MSIRQRMAWLVMTLGFLAACSAGLDDKQVVGETALIDIPELSLPYLARIDTGAQVTSIHAVDVEVLGGADSPRDNIGKRVRFTSINEHNRKVTYEAPIVGVATVRNAQGVEYRYEVSLTAEWQGQAKPVVMNLRDRSAMTYKLLIGRNWLKGDYVVDVEVSEGEL